MARSPLLPLRSLVSAGLISLASLSFAAATEPLPLKPNSRQQVQLMTTPRPLFFSDLVALDTQQHQALTLPSQRRNFSFAAKAHLLPLTVAELGAAIHHYPVVFVQEGDAVALVALTGLPNAGNRFVDGKGEWRANTYIPAYVRGYPFIAVRPAPGAEPVIAFDPNATDFKAKDGQALILADRQPSEQLKGILAFHGEYQMLAERTQVMTRVLKAEGVLEEGQMNVQAPNGSSTQIGGFLVVNEGKLRALGADALKRLMEADALGLAYAHLFSMGNLGQLLAEPAPTAETTSRRNSSRKSAE